MAKKPLADYSERMYGICHLNVVPLVDKPNGVGIMFNQLLFGETFTVIFKKNKFWIKIQTSNCSVPGWVQTNQIQLLTEKEYLKLSNTSPKSLEISHPVFKEDIVKNIVLGSNLPCFDGISSVMPDGKYIYNGQATSLDGLDATADLVVKIARRYLHTPELLGGRSPYGIDSGALIQLTFGFFQIDLPRFPSEQCVYGDDVDFMDYVKEGDVAFCESKDGYISHAGIIIGHKKVLHVYGSVRIDHIDHFGIFNEDIRKYTHRLRIVKRFIPDDELFETQGN